MKPYTWSKQPAEVRKLEMDASKSVAVGDSVLSATAVMYDGGTDVSSAMITGTPTVLSNKIYVVVKGGVDGKEYYLKVVAATVMGDIIEDDLRVLVKQIGK
jgi:hypothetical protein